MAKRCIVCGADNQTCKPEHGAEQGPTVRFRTPEEKAKRVPNKARRTPNKARRTKVA